MFSPGPTGTPRPSLSRSERPSSSRGRPEQMHVPESSAKGSLGGWTRAGGSAAREIVDLSSQTSESFPTMGRSWKRQQTFDANSAPYPFSYEPRIVDLDVLDHIFLTQLRKNVTWIDFKDKPPKRSLDLGCAWILDAAKEWKDCHFVGFDLARIQSSLDLLPKCLANRIQWVHGNFLSGRLPFEDNFFDHVHIFHIAWGVGEMHWDGLFEEIARVLCPGGVIEVAEEDILFPTLPRSYTIKTKQSRPSAPYPRPSPTLSPPPSPLDDDADRLPHAHALLESLFFGVFESRMINLRPTAIIPHHLNIHFRNVLSTPIFECPFPPPPIARQQLRHIPSNSTARPRRRSDGSENSFSSSDSIPRQQQTPPMTNSSLSSLSDSSERVLEPLPEPPPFKPFQIMMGTFKQTAHQGVSLLPPVPVDMTSRNLSLQLNTVYQRIVGCKEAMWEELRRRLLLRRAGGLDQLQGLGWEDDDDDDTGNSSDSGHGHEDGPGVSEARELERARVRFDGWVQQFERDLRYRTALADVLEMSLGWTKPVPTLLSKHERLREAELERAIAEAARAEAEEAEQVQCSRSFKGFVGFKEGKR